MIKAVSAVLPVLNEEEILEETHASLCRVLEELLGSDYEIILVDDGSEDNTPQILTRLDQHPNTICILNTGPNGIGACVRRGWDAARFDSMLYLDADGPIDYMELKHLFRHAPKFPIVVASRDVRGETLGRTALSAAYNAVVRRLFPVGVPDVHFGVKLVSKEALQKVSLQADTAFFNVELLAQAAAFNIPVKNIPLHYVFRSKGVSKGLRWPLVLNLVREMASFYWRFPRLRTSHGKTPNESRSPV